MAKNKAKTRAATTRAATVATPSTPIKQQQQQQQNTPQADDSVQDASLQESDDIDGSISPEDPDATVDATTIQDDSDDEEVSQSQETPSATSSSQSNVVVCVRMRPAPEVALTASSAATPEKPWTVDARTNTVEATESHPSLAKRAPSSAPQTGSTTLASSASSSFIAGDASSSTNIAGASNSSETYKFKFDRLVPPEVTSLDDLYTTNISPVVNGSVQGYNGTVFAYGQTGSGKTYTMSGGGDEQGIISRAIQEVFRCVEQTPDREFLLRVSYLEIYNESLRDLLITLPSSASSSNNNSTPTSSRPASPTKGGYSHSAASSSASSAGSTLRIMEKPSSGRVTIAGLREEIVTQPSQVMDLLVKGQAARHQAATDWNERSSRSHCVATLTIESRWKEDPSGPVRVSALNLIDLAGSERAASEKERRKEGAFINKSLLTLGSVISKLSMAASNPGAAAAHIPYRDSKLTRLLQTSLSGNARVAVLLTMSPLTKHAIEGLSTLKFGKRCKMIKLKAKRGEIDEGEGGANEALLRKYRREVERLRAKLESAPNESDDASPSPMSSAEMAAVQERKRLAETEVQDMTRQKAELRKQMDHLTRLIVTSNTLSESRRRRQAGGQDGTDEDADEGDDVVSSSSLFGLSSGGGGPGTPIRRGRISEFGTPGTPKGSIAFLQQSSSPKKRAGSNLRTTGSSSADNENPFAMETEVASLRKKLAAALEDRSQVEEDHKRQIAEREEDKSSALLEQSEALLTKATSEKEEALKLHNEKVVALETRLKDAQSELASKHSNHSAASTAAERELKSAKEALSILRNELSELKSELEVERAKRLKAEETLSKRPESEEEITQREFDELVQSTRDAENAKSKNKSHLTAVTGASNLAPSTSSAALEAEAVAKRVKDVEQREASLVEREARLNEQQAHLSDREAEVAAAQTRLAVPPSPRPLPTPPPAATPNCDHLEELGLLKNALSEHKDKVSELQTQLSDEKKSHQATTSSFNLSRGGSLREYRRYQPPTLSSPGSNNRVLGGLNLSKSTSSSNAMAIEAAVKNERQEIERLNQVIVSQRNLMSDLETSVEEWKMKMRYQQDLIRQLLSGNQVNEEEMILNSNSIPRTTKLPTPPLQDGEEENFGSHLPRAKDFVTHEEEEARMTPRRRRYASNNSSPLKSSLIGNRMSNAGMDESDASDAIGYDFAKRRSAFLQKGDMNAKLRSGSSHTHTTTTNPSSPYYGAHMYNKPPPNKSTLAGLGLGLNTTAPNSPTKGTGLWGISPHPVPLPSDSEALTTPTKKGFKRRITIEHELEKLKQNSPKVDERTRELLDSPTKKGSARFNNNLHPGEDKAQSKDWYI
ncbi:unnamed protein product [Sympodiomycopsis kandeliae]